MGSLGNAVREEASWGKTWNGADALKTTQSMLLDMFGRAGAMRECSHSEREIMFSRAFKEDKDAAVKLLFYTRDIRGGYGEKDTFKIMWRHLAELNPESVDKNLWAVLEFGCAKDLYALIGTPAEDAMWKFMKEQFELDLHNMEAGKGISLLAKWIATPNSHSERTKELGKKTAKHLGYSYKTMREYSKKLRSLRKYLDLPEAKMCDGRWDEIEYSKCSSRFLLKNRKAIQRHDGVRWQEYIDSVNSGDSKMNMGAVTPCDIITKVRSDYTTDLEAMWKSLPDLCNGNAMVMCDTSGSMTWSYYSNVAPIDVAVGLSIYFAQRNKGDLKNLMMNFSKTPEFIELNASNLKDNYKIAMDSPVNYNSTNLEAAFDLLLKTCVRHEVPQEDMPDSILVISDMQINCVQGIGADKRLTFYDVMARRYEDAGYKMPQVVFWNVNALNATFHATADTKGVSLVSGYSPNVFKNVMENIGTTPMELMWAVINNERYKDIVA